jgi:hypothetical protein
MEAKAGRQMRLLQAKSFAFKILVPALQSCPFTVTLASRKIPRFVGLFAHSSGRIDARHLGYLRYLHTGFYPPVLQLEQAGSLTTFRHLKLPEGVDLSEQPRP